MVSCLPSSSNISWGIERDGYCIEESFLTVGTGEVSEDCHITGS